MHQLNTPPNNRRRMTLMMLAALLGLAVLITGAATSFAQSGSDDSISALSGSGSGDIRLRARGQAAINGIETELRGDFRAQSSPFRQQLSAELENIHLPIGTPVAFCLVRSSGTLRLHRSKVHLESGIKVAELDLDTNDGNTVPDVHVGDRIETHQARMAPFNPTPTCGSPLLVSAKFQ